MHWRKVYILGNPAVRGKCISCSVGDAAEIQLLLYFSTKQGMAQQPGDSEALFLNKMLWVLYTRSVFVEGLATIIIKKSQKFECTHTFAVCLTGFQQEKLLATNDVMCSSGALFSQWVNPSGEPRFWPLKSRCYFPSQC